MPHAHETSAFPTELDLQPPWQPILCNLFDRPDPRLGHHQKGRKPQFCLCPWNNVNVQWGITHLWPLLWNGPLSMRTLWMVWRHKHPWQSLHTGKNSVTISSHLHFPQSRAAGARGLASSVLPRLSPQSPGWRAQHSCNIYCT